MRRVRGSLERGSPSCLEDRNWQRPLDDEGTWRGGRKRRRWKRKRRRRRRKRFSNHDKMPPTSQNFPFASLVIDYDSHGCLPSSTFDLCPSLFHLLAFRRRPPFLLPFFSFSLFLSLHSCLFLSAFTRHQGTLERKGRPRSRSLSSYAKNAASRCYHGIRAIHRPLAELQSLRRTYANQPAAAAAASFFASSSSSSSFFVVDAKPHVGIWPYNRPGFQVWRVPACIRIAGRFDYNVRNIVI